MYVSDIMEIVIETAEKMLADSFEVPIGAVVARGNEIVAVAHNSTQKQASPLQHAEFLAVNQALQILNQKYLDTANIYVNLEPCYLCAAVLKKVRIKGIFFGAYSPKTGAVVHGERLFDSAGHKPVILGGIQETRCSNILSQFFAVNVRMQSDDL